MVFGYVTLKFRSVRESLGLGYFTWLVSTIGFATIQPGHNVNMMVWAGIGGFGLGAVVSQAIAGAQLSSPFVHLASATALSMTSRAIGAAVFTSIYLAVASGRVASNISNYITMVATEAGLDSNSTPAFVEALAAGDPELAAEIPGVTETILANGLRALQQASADGYRYVFIVASAFALLATVSCWWLGDFKKVMNYHVDAPVEKLTAKAEQKNKL